MRNISFNDLWNPSVCLYLYLVDWSVSRSVGWARSYTSMLLSDHLFLLFYCSRVIQMSFLFFLIFQKIPIIPIYQPQEEVPVQRHFCFTVSHFFIVIVWRHSYSWKNTQDHPSAFINQTNYILCFPFIYYIYDCKCVLLLNKMYIFTRNTIRYLSLSLS